MYRDEKESAILYRSAFMLSLDSNNTHHFCEKEASHNQEILITIMNI